MKIRLGPRPHSHCICSACNLIYSCQCSRYGLTHHPGHGMLGLTECISNGLVDIFVVSLVEIDGVVFSSIKAYRQHAFCKIPFLSSLRHFKTDIAMLTSKHFFQFIYFPFAIVHVKSSKPGVYMFRLYNPNSTVFREVRSKPFCREL